MIRRGMGKVLDFLGQIASMPAAFFFSLTVFLLLSSSCSMVPKSHIGDRAVATERIELKSTDEEQIWRTGELALHYNLSVKKQYFEIHGFAEVDTSITYTFPSAEYLSIYIYLLDGDGVAVSRHTVLPSIAVYSAFADKASFSATIEYDQQTSFIAFGYLGSFFSIEDDGWGRRRGYEKIEWEIYHDPFP